MEEKADNSPAKSFQTAKVLTVASSHFVHDTYSAFLAPMLPVLRGLFGTNYVQTGSLIIFAQLPSILNPFIGYLADRTNLRNFIVIAPAITATLISLMGYAPTYLMLVLLLLATGVSVAAFHSPASAIMGDLAGDEVGKGMGYFMAAGELGRMFGPLIVGWFLPRLSILGLWRLSLVGWLVSFILYQGLKDVQAVARRNEAGLLARLWPQIWRVFSLLGWFMLARSFMLAAQSSFLPLYMTDVAGTNFVTSSWSLMFFEAGGVVGALTAGTVSDKIGRSRTLLFVFLLAPIFHLIFLNLSTSFALPMLILVGIVSLSPTAVLFAVVHDNFPDNRAFGNGIFLMVNFLARAVGIWGFGRWADAFGIGNAFFWSAIVALLSVPAVFLLSRISLNKTLL